MRTENWVDEVDVEDIGEEGRREGVDGMRE